MLNWMFIYVAIGVVSFMAYTTIKSDEFRKIAFRWNMSEALKTILYIAVWPVMFPFSLWAVGKVREFTKWAETVNSDVLKEES